MELKFKAKHKYMDLEWIVAGLDLANGFVTVYLSEEEKKNYKSKFDTMSIRNILLYQWNGEEYVEVSFPE